ncbi:MAG: hypothetical protein SFU27_00065 [Thermonemataceae bacterium]|nr:hypothetical protein [Thermonemataceae bacterium]
MKVFDKIKLRREIRWTAMALLLIATLSISASKYQNQHCKSLQISIEDEGKTYFLDKQDIQALLDSNSRDFILNTNYALLHTKKLERRVKNSPYVEDCQISKNLDGSLDVKVALVKPSIRILGAKESFYIDATGKKIPLSKKYTINAIILTTDSINFDFKSNIDDKKLLDLLNFIVNSDIWNTNIVQINKNKKNLKFYLQLSNTEIDFGSWENWEEKMQKMEILCKFIFPKKGWNTYQKVSLKYHQQIVCEYAKR